MKPIHLNLASRPYRDYRAVNAVAAAMFLVMLILAWYNVDTALRYRMETKSTRARIEHLEAQKAQEEQRQDIVDRRLHAVDLGRLDDQTRFINAKLSERAFSWSMLLDELESILSDNVRLTSIAPSFRPDGLILLSLAFESRSANGMIDTINRMNADPHFTNPFPGSDTMNGGGTWNFSLTVTYHPPDLRGGSIKPVSAVMK